MKRTFVITQLNPEPWTAAKIARVGQGKTVAFKDRKTTAYQRALKDDLGRLVDGHLVGKRTPIHLRLAFWRDTSDGQQCDATNLQKSTEDALQGILFHDDKWVKSVSSVIVEQRPGLAPGLVIEISDQPLGKPWWPQELPAAVSVADPDLKVEHDRRATYNPETTF